MKKAISIRSAAMAFLILFLVKSTLATDSTTALKASSTLVYVGKFESHPVFQLQFSNPENDHVYVTIKDTDQTVLFSETLTGKMISRKYGLDVSSEDLSTILIEVTTKKSKLTQVYQITDSTYKVDNVSLAKF